MIAKSRLDDSGDAGTSKDTTTRTLVYKLRPNSTIGPILSVRAFEFESVYGLDTREPANSQCGQPLAWAYNFSEGEKVSKKTHNVTSPSVLLPPAHRIFVFTLGDAPRFTLGDAP